MSTIYIPQPIETADDVEALPIGSIALFDGVPEAWKCGCVDYDTTPPTHGVWHASTAGRELPPDWWVGCVALVPVDADVQTSTAWERIEGRTVPCTESRLVTPWKKNRP